MKEIITLDLPICESPEYTEEGYKRITFYDNGIIRVRVSIVTTTDNVMEFGRDHPEVKWETIIMNGVIHKDKVSNIVLVMQDALNGDKAYCSDGNLKICGDGTVFSTEMMKKDFAKYDIIREYLEKFCFDIFMTPRFEEEVLDSGIIYVEM